MTTLNKIFSKYKNRIEITILSDIEGQMKWRIFNEGRASDGAMIGSYSTKPMAVSPGWASKKAYRRLFGSKKKRRGYQWFTKNKKRLAVLPGGYKQYREAHGLQTAYVDLMFKGDLFRSIQRGKSGGHNVLGFTLKTSLAKAEGNEARFKKKIFDLSVQESTSINTFVREIDLIIKEFIDTIK